MNMVSQLDIPRNDSDLELSAEGFEIQRISSFSEFLALESEWNLLAKESSDASCFLSHEWFRCCIRHYGEQKELCILIVKKFGVLKGIAPLWVAHHSLRKIPIKKIEFIASRDSPSVNFLTCPSHSSEIIHQFIQFLKIELKKEWDILVLQQLPMDSSDYTFFKKTLDDEKMPYTEWDSSVIPFIPMKGTWDEFLQTKSVRIRKTYRNVWNRVHKLEGFEVETFQYQLNESTVCDLFSVAEKGWKYLEGKSLANGEANKGFFVALTQVSLQKGWLLLWFLKSKGIPIAMEYDLVSDGKVFALRSDFDEQYKENSPGAFLEAWILRWLFENGYQEYNYGPGLNQYKLHWATHFKNNRCVCLFNTTLKGKVLYLVEAVFKPLIKKWFR